MFVIKLTCSQVRDQVNTIMFEGHDTTAAGTSFFLALMAVHEDIQVRNVALRHTLHDN